MFRLTRFVIRSLSTAIHQRSKVCERTGEALVCRYACRLKHRALVKMDGAEGRSFLQGFVTADLERQNDREMSLVYSMMLNAQGRVLYDVLIYNVLNDSYYLECDASLRNEVVTHLRKYALRVKVNFSAVDDFNVWALFPGQPVPLSNMKDCIYLPDPRHHEFGTRAIVSSKTDASDIWSGLETTDTGAYHDYRLLLGLPEGSDEIISGQSLPLECNLDHLNGVSFDKGCYLGQELTARTHHTGVIRKRIMPITLNHSPAIPITSGSPITNISGKRVGKLLSHRGHLGLGLMKLAEINKEPMTVADSEESKIEVTTHIPDYWPTEHNEQ